jgi:hypothetical protein
VHEYRKQAEEQLQQSLQQFSKSPLKESEEGRKSMNMAFIE